MANNPQTNLGTLNRLRASIQFATLPALNVTASFLGREGISIAFEGTATTTIGAMVGTVQSPEPYQMARVMAHLLKTQTLATVYKAQFESNTLVGDALIRVDALGFPTYQIYNCALQEVRELDLSGRDAGYVVSFTGTYQTNSSLFDLV